MFRTYKLSLAALSLAAVAVVASSANATEVNVQAYHHRSTALGDHLSGYADAVDAEGRYLRNRSVAYKTFISALRDREKLIHEHKEYVRYEEEIKQKDIDARAERNRANAYAKKKQREEGAKLLLQDIQTRRHIWSEVLAAEKFALHRFQIETLLRNWEDGYPSDRRRLELTVRKMEDILTADPPEDFLKRRDAIATLRLLEELSKSRDYDFDPQSQMSRHQQLKLVMENLVANK